MGSGPQQPVLTRQPHVVAEMIFRLSRGLRGSPLIVPNPVTDRIMHILSNAGMPLAKLVSVRVDLHLYLAAFRHGQFQRTIVPIQETIYLPVSPPPPSTL
jgi:hypothetical protein